MPPKRTNRTDRPAAPERGLRRRPRGGLVRRRVLPLVGRLAAALALLLLAAWTTGIVLNDRFAWSQPLWWLPDWPVVTVSWFGWFVSAAAERLGTRMAGAKARPLLLVGAVLATLYLLLWPARLERLLLPPPPPGPSALRVAYWNAAWTKPTGARPALESLDADVLAVANTKPGPAARELAGFMRQIALAWRADAPQPPEPADDDLARFDRPHLVAFDTLTLISRRPIVARGHAPLDLPPTRYAQLRQQGRQTGVAFVVLAGDDARPPLTIWIVDLPSDPGLHRAEVMAAAARAAAGWSPSNTENQNQDQGAPEPDVVIGDFNTPRGSASLSRLTAPLRDAHATSGRGLNLTWPLRLPGLGEAARPLWAIDLAFVGRGWRAVGFQTTDPGVGLHAAISVDVEPTTENRGG